MGPMTLALRDVQDETFGTRSRCEGEGIVVQMRGNADIGAQERLKTFLDALHLEAKRLKVRETVFDLEELYFMNSSCLSLLLRHINAIMQATGGQGYRLKFRSNPNLRWQRRSLQALRSYAPDIVTVE
jgi:anti-anti-sigma factor